METSRTGRPLDSQPTSQAPLAVRNTNTALPRPTSRLPMKQPLVSRPVTDTAVSSTENVPCQPSVEPVQRELTRPAKRIKLDPGSEASRMVAPPAPAAGPVLARKNAAGSTLAGRGPASGRAATSKPSTIGRAQPTTTSASRSSAGLPSAKTACAQVPPAAPSGAPSKKRAAWDVKGQLEDSKAQVAQQRQEMDDTRAKLRLTSDELNGRTRQLAAVTHDLELERQLREQTERKLVDAEALHNQTQQALRKALSDAVEDALTKLELEQQLRVQAEADCHRRLADAEVRHVKAEQALREALRAAVEDASSKEAALRGAELRIAELEQKQRDMERKQRDLETCRRRLHNEVMELKGNIRVFCRVRPRLDIDSPGSDIVSFPDSSDLKKVLELRKPASALLDESSVGTCGAGGSSAKGPSTMHFSFDRVFAPCESQQDVFDEVAQLVQSALDGFNVCIFAYGPTGSGKTFTMEGLPPSDPSAGTLSSGAGIIPRAIQQVFETSHELANQGWQHKFEASFLEIYNEKIQDLLSTSKDDVKYEIKMAANGNSEVSVTNLTTKLVDSPAQVTKLLARAAQNRAVAATKCNERSSRSHSVFMLKITGSNTATGESCAAMLNLIDLAGSERLKESGSEGTRLQETKAINKSLSCLGNVIMAIGNKNPHIPYRDSKLTHLLQPSLGGNSKCLMFLNVSQREEAYNETVISLRFGVKVNQCNIGTAQKKSK